MKNCRKHYKKVNKLKKVKCAFAAERYVPEKMESFYVRNLFQVDQISDRHQSSDVLNEKFED